MAANTRQILLTDGDHAAQPAPQEWIDGQLAVANGTGNEVGVGLVGEEVAKVAGLEDNVIWLSNEQIAGIKDGTWDGMVKVWIPVQGKPGVKDENWLCPNTGSLYKVPSGSFQGHMRDLIPEAAQFLAEAFDIRDEKLKKDGTFFQYPENKNRPGAKGQEYDLAFELSRRQRATLGRENPGDLVVFLRNHTTGDIEPFMAPKERIASMDWNDVTKVAAINKWRGQVFIRKLDQLRFDRGEEAMWTSLEQQLLAYFMRNMAEYCAHLGITVDKMMDRIDWEKVTNAIRQNFEPQPAGTKFVILPIDQPTEPDYDQRRTLRKDRDVFEHTAEEVEARATDSQTLAKILETEVDEQALASDEPWASFLIAEQQKKGRNKVATGRVVKSQSKRKNVATGVGKRKSDAIMAAVAGSENDQAMEEGDSMDVDEPDEDSRT